MFCPHHMADSEQDQAPQASYLTILHLPEGSSHQFQPRPSRFSILITPLEERIHETGLGNMKTATSSVRPGAPVEGSNLVPEKCHFHSREGKKESEVAQSCPTLCDPMEPARPLCLWDSLGKNTRVCCLALLQGIFPTQRSNPGLLHCRWIPLSHLGSPAIQHFLT